MDEQLFSKSLDDLLPPVPKSPLSRLDTPFMYEDVPWYRREPRSLVLLLALFFAPVTIALCIIALSGNVYKNERDSSGNLETWGVGNKVAAVLLLALQGFVLWQVYGEL